MGFFRSAPGLEGEERDGNYHPVGGRAVLCLKFRLPKRPQVYSFHGFHDVVLHPTCYDVRDVWLRLSVPARHFFCREVLLFGVWGVLIL